MTCHVVCGDVETVEELRYLILGAQREGARALAELLRPAGLTAAQAEVIRDGRGAMPAWEGTLSPAQIDAVVRYTREVL